MPLVILVLASLALAPAARPEQVTGCDLLANPDKFDGKVVQFVGYRLPTLETVDYSPFGCVGRIGITKFVEMRDHRYAGEGIYRSRAGLMVPATKIEGRVRVVRAPEKLGRIKKTTFVNIDDARIESAGYRLYEKPGSRRWNQLSTHSRR